MVAPAPQPRPLFPLGQIVATPGAIRALDVAGQDPADFIGRHVCGDFGELDAEDWKANEFAIAHGNRILSAFKMRNGVRIWIVTEGDRSVTTVLLPEEY